ncbi:MAG: CT253 family lipoprotein [Candidatus Rhabdochlamydia sp.]
MKQLNLIFFSLTIFLGGCAHRQSTFSMEKPVSNRPIVSLAPMINHSKPSSHWNVAQELSQTIRAHLANEGTLYLLSKDLVDNLSDKIKPGKNPFSHDLQWIKKAYPPSEFVAFFELLQHKMSPLNHADSDLQPTSSFLNLSMRVRVFDVRSASPQVVLEELIEHSHYLPLEAKDTSWGDNMFDLSPIGLAHEKLCQEVACRVEDYILIRSVNPIE